MVFQSDTRLKIHVFSLRPAEPGDVRLIHKLEGHVAGKDGDVTVNDEKLAAVRFTLSM